MLEEEFIVKDVTSNIPSIQNDENYMKVPLSSVAVWVDPLDATKEFTGW